MPTHDEVQREILPSPDIPQVGLTTNHAKDPDTAYPPIEPLRPQARGWNVVSMKEDLRTIF